MGMLFASIWSGGPGVQVAPCCRDRFVAGSARGFPRTFPAPLSRQLYEDLCIAEELPSADHEAAAASCDHPSRSGDAFPPRAKRAVLTGIRGNLRQTRAARLSHGVPGSGEATLETAGLPIAEVTSEFEKSLCPPLSKPF
jgi:hypothetical protein